MQLSPTVVSRRISKVVFPESGVSQLEIREVRFQLHISLKLREDLNHDFGTVISLYCKTISTRKTKIFMAV